MRGFVDPGTKSAGAARQRIAYHRPDLALESLAVHGHARRALQQTVDVSAEAFEVRAAQTLLERLAAGPVTPR